MTSDEYALHHGTIKKLVDEWRRGKTNMLKATINNLGVKDTGELLRSLSSKTYVRYGVTEGVGFSLERRGIMVEYGVGKHRPLRGGNIHPRKWFSAVINEAAIAELADIVSSEMADQVVNSSRILK